MMATTTLLTGDSRLSQADRWQIADQLSRILVSPWFRTSSRCSQLLRHAVELAIHGQTDRLKERQIAIEAFHRKPTYDNNSDPVVRVAAGEVRKRLAQYYADPETSGQVRIELPVGTYIPVFQFPDSLDEANDAQLAASRHEKKPHHLEDHQTPRSHNLIAERTPLQSRRLRYAIGAVALLITIILGSWQEIRSVLVPAGFDAFWAQMLSSPKVPLLSLGELRATELTFAPNPERNGLSDRYTISADKSAHQNIPVERVAYSRAAAYIASILGAKGRSFEILDQSATTFTDFKGRPTVLFGSYDNDWSMGITAGKRFQFKYDNIRGQKWIADNMNAGKEIGTMPISSVDPTTYDAFSIVLREKGQVTGQPRMLLAGIGDSGTIAAAEFASNPKYLNDFAIHAPKNWSKKNIEFLLKTRVIEGVIGDPVIVDYNIW